MTGSRRRRVGVVAAALALAAATACTGGGATPSRWAAETATRLTTTDPAAPLDDLAPVVGRASRDAVVVGLGESVHGVAEEVTLKHRALRVLVEQEGFRSVAWEEDWTTGRRIDAYLTTGVGDPVALTASMSPQWQSREVTEVLRWLRAFNVGRPDPVRFVGVEYYLTGVDAYDDLTTWAARAGPARSTAIAGHLRAIRPTTSDPFAHIAAYQQQPDKGPALDHARVVLDLVEGAPHLPGDRAYAAAAHTARQILAFHEHFALPRAASHTYRDARTAENLAWWRDLEGSRVAYWAASPHTAAARNLRITAPGADDLRFTATGSHLRDRYGSGYRSIGFTLGAVSTGRNAPTAPAAPAESWFERPLSSSGPTPFALDLRAPAPPTVRRWLDGPIITRGPNGPGSVVGGGSAASWFDVIVHVDRATPTSPA